MGQTQFGGIQPGLVTDKEVAFEIIAAFVDETKTNCRNLEIRFFFFFFECIKLLPAAEAHNAFFSHETI